MSFSIGPFIGKRDAVIKAVKEAKGYGDTSQLEVAKALIVAELELLPAEKQAFASASGHHDGSGNRNLTVAINNSTYPMVPLLVE